MSAAPTVMTQPFMGRWTITYSNAGIDQGNTSFYYDNQMIHLLADHGLPLINITLAEIDYINWWKTAAAINYAAQAGGCGVMFFVVLLLAQASKRRTPIFILNVLSLLLGFLRGLFLALYFLTTWVNMYPYLTNDWSAIPTGAYFISIFGALCAFLMNATVNLSLVLQVYTVNKNIKDAYRYALIAMCGLILFLDLGFSFAQMVMSDISIILAKADPQQWVDQGALYTETISIWYFSIIFTAKLVYTLNLRRKRSWKQWSGVKILAAMGGCTIVIPSIFAILQDLDQQIGDTFPVAGTLSLTMVALLLPLSSLWASMAINNESAILDLSLLSGFNSNSNSKSNSNSNSNMSNASNATGSCSFCRGGGGGGGGNSNNFNKRTPGPMATAMTMAMPSAQRIEYADYEHEHGHDDDFEAAGFYASTIKNKIECSERIGGDGQDRNRDHDLVAQDAEEEAEAIGVRVQKSYSLQTAREQQEDEILSH